jgi:hypothetical protein
MVEEVLSLSRTWTAWDGRPIPAGDRVYTPHKALRRVADHLIDHLAQMEARVAGVPDLPDRWHGSYMTTPADNAPITPEDLQEAESRLSRLAQIWQLRLESMSPEQLDDGDETRWSIREIVFHVLESIEYAEPLGLMPSSE